MGAGRSLSSCLVLLAALGAALLGGCGGAPAARSGSTATSPVPRASMMGANPCALLTNAQRHRLGIGPGSPAAIADQWPGQQCLWTGYPSANGDRYLGRVITGAVPGGSPAAPINAYPTTSYTSPGADPNRDCVYLVAVPPGRTLWAEYRNDQLAGLTRVISCRKAQAAAAAMASTYRSLPV
jgi:hypothetical protein